MFLSCFCICVRLVLSLSFVFFPMYVYVCLCLGLCVVFALFYLSSLSSSLSVRPCLLLCRKRLRLKSSPRPSECSALSCLVLSRIVLSCLDFVLVLSSFCFLSFVFRVGRFVRRRAELTKKVLAFSYYGRILSCLCSSRLVLSFFLTCLVLSCLFLCRLVM